MSTKLKSAGELATELVQAFGRPDAIVSLLAESATWWITPSVPSEIMTSVSTGRETIRENMQRVFSLLYNGDTMKTQVHDVVSDGSLGVVRFTLTGEFPNGGSYSNEYTVWVETAGDEIARVWEYVDGAQALIQMQAAGIDIAPNASA